MLDFPLFARAPYTRDDHTSLIIPPIADDVSPGPEMDEHLATHAIIHRLTKFWEVLQLPCGVCDSISGLARRLLVVLG